MSTMTMETGPIEDMVIDEAKAAEIDRTIRTIPDTQLRSADGRAPGLDFEVSKDPVSHFRRLHEEQGDVVLYENGRYGDVEVFSPFGHDLDQPNYAVLGYHAIRDMVTDPEHFINADAYGGHGKAGGKVMVNELDGMEHRRTRMIFDGQILGRKRLAEYADASIQPMADHLVKRIRKMLDEGEPVDMSRDLAVPLVYSSIARIIGLPMVDLSYFVKTAETAFSGNRDMQAAMAAVAELTSFFEKEYNRRVAEGDMDGDDLMAMMARIDHKGFTFSGEDIIAYCRFLLPAGIETTWRQTANMCLALLGHPEQYRDCVKDQGLHAQAIEECLRWMPSGSILPRICAKETELGGVTIPAGASMCGVFVYANRDFAVWPDGDVFDIHRKKIPHLTFSTGSHFCMGQKLARQVFAEALKAMTEILPDIELARPVEDVITTGLVIRSPDEVPVKRV